MAKEISWEIREQAEELYIVDGKTFEEVAEITGVSIGQLKRWGAGFPDPDDPESKSSSWTDRKKEYRTAFANIRRDTVLLRKKMTERALKSLDPQDLYAVVKLETMAARQNKKEEKTVQIDRPALFLEDMEFIAKTLKEIDPEGLKIFAMNFDVIIQRFKEQYAQEA